MFWKTMTVFVFSLSSIVIAFYSFRVLLLEITNSLINFELKGRVNWKEEVQIQFIMLLYHFLSVNHFCEVGTLNLNCNTKLVSLVTRDIKSTPLPLPPFFSMVSPNCDSRNICLGILTFYLHYLTSLIFSLNISEFVLLL